MKKAGLIKVSLLLLFFFLPMLASAAEIEDPYYKQWASFKIGSNVTLVGRADAASGVSSFTQTITLKEINNNHLVTEIARIEEKVAPVNKKKNVDRYIDKADKLEYNGQEEIPVAGKNVLCQVYTLKVIYDSGKEMIVYKYWFNSDIPGFTKVVATTGKAMVTQTAVKWEKK
jgi:hypothetical protein